MLHKSKIFILLLCFFGLIFSNISKTTAIHDIKVVVKPRRIDSRASYLITLKLDEALQVHDWIKVIWPKETKLPKLPDDPIERNAELKRIIESIFIGTSPCSACQGYPEINYKENSIRFNIHLELNPNIHGYEQINITITDRVGIVNPSKPGLYELKIATSKEQSAMKSIPYEIVESHLGVPEGIPEVSVTPNGNYATGEYKIVCNVGTGGALLFNQSRIRIHFPPETILSKKPQSIEPYFIKVNNKAVMNKIMIAEQVLTFISPVNTENSEKIVIVLEKGCGIINPNFTGSYTLKISTSEDLDWVSSKPYLIDRNFESLSIEPNKANRYATYKFQFLSGKEMEANDPIYILFPTTVLVPNIIDVSTILVNQKPIKSVTVKDHEVLLFIKEIIPANTLLAIEFTEKSMIKNPAISTTVSLGYKTTDRDQFLFTSEVQIEKTIFTIQSIQIEPPNASAIASFSFHLLVDNNDGIKPSSLIIIDFPMGTQIPDLIPNQEISINNQPVTFAQKTAENQLTINVPEFLPYDIEVFLKIEKEVVITNPSQGNQLVSFIVSSSLDDAIKANKEVFLYPPLPKTDINFISGVKGKDDWFVKSPIMDFVVSDKDSKTYFFWNGNDKNILEFLEPKVLPDGQYQTIISYYSESPYGKEEVKTVTIKVDTVYPKFILTNPSEKNVKTNELNILIAGSTQAQEFGFKGEDVKLFDTHLFINEKLFPILSNDGFFSFLYNLQIDQKDLLISLEDSAGNKTGQEFIIDYKKQKPFCKISHPTNGEWILEKEIQLKGAVDPKSKVSSGDLIAKVDENGSFKLDLQLSLVGQKKLSILVQDEYGNKEEFFVEIWYGYSIQMQINSLHAINNNQKRELDLAPFIKESRTMLPFRFLGEELRATISFEKDPVTKLVNKIEYVLNGTTVSLTIGSMQGLVNGKLVSLDSPPIIIKGRTVVPLRFVTENLGCVTEWDPNTKGIIIKYAP